MRKYVWSYIYQRHIMKNKDHPLYQTWAGMKTRCYNPKAANYENYGGRGITVCDRWRDDFWAFVADMGSKPAKGVSLDRRDGDGCYEPSNCRWATASEQNRNRRKPTVTDKVLRVKTASRCCVGCSFMIRGCRLQRGGGGGGSVLALG
jgi:hypothetical protein